MIHVYLTEGVCQRSKDMGGESYLKFQKCINELKKHGYLNQEIPLAGNDLFAFIIDCDWVATAQRDEDPTKEDPTKEDPTKGDSRKFEIVVSKLMPMSEFNPLPPPLPPEENWMTKITKTILQFFHRPYPLIVAGVVVFIPIAGLAVGCDKGVKVKTKTDGNQVMIEITCDNRQPE